ncbi:prolyl-tRNA synthetase associated domain-containing protein [Lacticaseibacillus camelliae]|uniref:YbaK/aminoacyl-tRNA synthetase-associated domain-containing protein n=1 Tax=Lacticaseibacillus camelliae DSM 22697 = JCM 13995 TaxID=1423730 RepID=A0A0R2FAZ4_9LACO|nr:prolyl-tRNA synthetase associated domain-containing protein [Lacticaseibacillus camelliae]KRN25570.1 hypothetical protein FC75_GL000300 [Lacticaseibacillus camelliae DSM 22697 = JCM 13995]
MTNAAAVMAWLKAQGLAYRVIEHPAVFTTAEADRLVPPFEGSRPKNLLVTDQKRFFLVILDEAKRLDFKALWVRLGSGRLTMASAAQLQTILGVAPGSVSVFNVLNDEANAVTVVIDRPVLTVSPVAFHPNDNTKTVLISGEAVLKFLAAAHHAPVLCEL